MAAETPYRRPHSPIHYLISGLRPLGVGMTSVGIPAGIGALHPLFGEILAGAELAVILAVTLTVIGTSLYRSNVLSERAFRLLRLIGNRPEPPGPKPGSASPRQLTHHAAKWPPGAFPPGRRIPSSIPGARRVA
jgi:hypothetical protein